MITEKESKRALTQQISLNHSKIIAEESKKETFRQ